MKNIWAFLLVFGIILLIKPELVGYILGAVCIALGTQFLLVSGLFSKKKQSNGPISFGGYEIYKKPK